MHEILNFCKCFFEVSESQVSSRFLFLHECNSWYHTQLYSITHSVKLIIKIQTFVYKSPKNPYSYLNANLDRKYFEMSSSASHMAM